MTQEIIELANKAGCISYTKPHTRAVAGVSMTFAQLEAFAKLVAEKTWAQGYQQGIEDERTSEANIGIAGFGMKVEPARENPYTIRARGTHE